MTPNKENMRLALHKTSKDKIESITRKGLKCKTYEDHPIAKECSVFFYPINGADRDIEFTPQNAILRNRDVDDSVYVVANIEDGIVGDMLHENDTERYLSNMMKYEEYLKECRVRGKFREPEVVVKGSVVKERILGSLNYTKMKKIYDDCYDKDKRFHKCDCIEKEIMKIIKQ